ncbi:hypothetical protein SBOR_3036 [Sclerotinia borealis F-4128]|uniref:Translation initiation factor eIF2B subunit delta n=1 Tax=Sclerotinia borealis (strain F-4128) TaxID=1432307 RepID=W9CPI1_SCLBF|nr:hypothetical protein SBOR_3036 [Sclerotinia borealis F-4128]
MAENDSELNDLFSSATASGGLVEADVLTELQSIMRLHSIPPQELFYKWESYSIKMGQDDMKLDIDTVRALKQNVQDGLEKENRKNKAHVSNKRVGVTPRNVGNNNDVFGMLDLTPNTPRSAMSSRPKRKPVTPSISRVKAEPASSPPDFKTSNNLKEAGTGVGSGDGTGSSYAPTSFNDRPHAGQTFGKVLNAHLEVAEPPIAPYSESRIKLTANSDMKKLSYKTMAMKSSEASEILDDRIDEFMLLVQAHHNLEDSDFGSAASQSTNEIVAVGRIACDSAEGKLNPSSIVLETSRRMGAGLRIPLKIDKMRGFKFFPGQIVALKGMNASGEDFTVSEILEPPLLGVAASTPAGLDEHVQRLRGGPDAMDEDSDPAPLNIIIGSGPFTADDNLNFEPLHAICSQAADTYADVLILTGPFLDIDHPLIASGDFDLPEELLSDPDSAAMTAIFKYLITPAFTQLTSTHPRITILLIPSVKDATNKHAAWPQEPFPKKDLGLPKAVRIVGNPMTIALNEIVMGISAQDVLYELLHEEIHKDIVGGKPEDNTIYARLPKYLIEQRHFFPLFPPVQRTQLPKTGTEDGISVGAMLDTGFLKLGEMINVRPDVLVVPSSLTPFAEVVESVLVINPGYLSKRRAAGTYAKLTVYPASMTEQERTQGTMTAMSAEESPAAASSANTVKSKTDSTNSTPSSAQTKAPSAKPGNVKEPATPTPDGGKLSAAELKKRAKDEKAARRAAAVQSKAGTENATPPPAAAGQKSDAAKGGKAQPKKGAEVRNLPVRGSTKSSPVIELPKVEDKTVDLFRHLYKPRTTSIAEAGKDVHPAVLALGLQMSNYTICGSCARLVATLQAFKRVVESYKTPVGASLTRHFIPHVLSPQIEYLASCRPLSVSMGNAIRWLKLEISKIDPDLSETDAKENVCDAIDVFMRERITFADKVIADTTAEKIRDGDVIMTYAKSSLVQKALVRAHEMGKKFRVIVVDSRPLREGKHLASALVTLGIEVKYCLIHGLSHNIQDVTKVLLGAHAMMTNGRLYSRVGTALVAMEASEADKPVIVLCETIKFSDRVALDSIVHNEIAPANELVIAGGPLENWMDVKKLQLCNPMYDVTPAEYIQMIVTESGNIPTTSVPVLHRLGNEAQ